MSGNVVSQIGKDGRKYILGIKDEKDISIQQYHSLPNNIPFHGYIKFENQKDVLPVGHSGEDLESFVDDPLTFLTSSLSFLLFYLIGIISDWFSARLILHSYRRHLRLRRRIELIP